MNVLEDFVSVTVPPATVEHYLTDPALMQQWRSPLVTIEALEGTWMAVGSKYRTRLVALALLAGADYTVTERDSSHILVRFTGAWQGTELWRWFADGPRTIVQHRVEYEVPNPSLRVFVNGLGVPFAQFDMRLQMVRMRDLAEGRRRLAAERVQHITVETQ